RTLLKETFAAACAQAMDDAADEALRASAVRYIGCYSLAHAKDSLVALLGGRTPIQVQLEAVRALANYPNSDVAAQLIESFRNVTPQVQELIIEVLLSRDMWMRQLLEAAAAQRMSL